MERGLTTRLATQADLDARVLAAAQAVAHVPMMPPARSAPVINVDQSEPDNTAALPEPEAVGAVAVADEPEAPHWPDEASESAFLADAQERGEVVTRLKSVEPTETTDEAQPLPSLDALVERIPAKVRDTLEELFRAKFVKVQRVPKRALKK